MNNIIELVKARNTNNELFSMNDIKNIINILASDFSIRLEKIVNKKNKYIMSLSLRDLEFVVDYHQLIKNEDIIYTNYLILFAICHELRHYLQLFNDLGIVGSIYDECFKYINSSLILKTAFYSRFHDYFPVEMNANIVGLLYVMYIQKVLGDQVYFNIFKNTLLEVLKKVEDHDALDVLSSILGDDYVEILNGMNEYELFINGLLRDNSKRDKMLQMILL